MKTSGSRGGGRRHGLLLSNFISFLLLISAIWLLRAQVLTFFGGLLVKEQPPTKADAIVVLGGDQYGNRILKAADLAKQGYAPVVWVSTGVDPLGCQTDANQLFLAHHGLSASMFHMVSLHAEDDSTRGEAVVLGKDLQATGVHKILLVTSNFHTARANYLWRRENPWLDVVIVGSPDPNFTPDSWWKTRGGEKTFLYEWMKTVVAHSGH